MIKVFQKNYSRVSKTYEYVDDDSLITKLQQIVELVNEAAETIMQTLDESLT